MFYETTLKSHVRVDPLHFDLPLEDAVLASLKDQFNNFISKDFGVVIAVSEVVEVGDGIIIPGDGAPYYDTTFKIYCFKPEMQEIMFGTISDITDFGAFINIGPLDGMIHISQTMDDFVSYNKTNALSGKQSKRVLKTGDKCKARIIAISYKSISDPKIGLTMRQPYLGNLNWETEPKKEAKPRKPAKK